jgi:predicted Zn-dependent protease
VAAVPHFRRFLAAQPKEPRARQLLGVCLVETGNAQAAIPELEAVYKTNPQDPSIAYNLAYAYARAGNEARAAITLNSAPIPETQQWLLEAVIEYKRGRFAEARALYDKVVAREPGNAQALAGIARLGMAVRDDATGIEYLERAVALMPQDAEAVYQLGVLYTRNGRTEDGRRMLQRALDLRADYPDPHYFLGRILFEEKNYPGALQEFQTAAQLAPEQEAIRLMLGRTYQALGRKQEAQAEFAEVRRIKARVVEREQHKVMPEIPLEAAPGAEEGKP